MGFRVGCMGEVRAQGGSWRGGHGEAKGLEGELGREMGGGGVKGLQWVRWPNGKGERERANQGRVLGDLWLLHERGTGRKGERGREMERCWWGSERKNSLIQELMEHTDVESCYLWEGLLMEPFMGIASSQALWLQMDFHPWNRVSLNWITFSLNCIITISGECYTAIFSKLALGI